MRALCVGRHRFLSDHLGLYFRDLGVETTCVVGLEGALAVAAELRPDVVIADYDLLATLTLDRWERDAVLSQVPVIAVSLTRRPEEVHLLDANGLSGFLYLPTLAREDARRILAGVRRPTGGANAPYTLPSTLDWARPSTSTR